MMREVEPKQRLASPPTGWLVLGIAVVSLVVALGRGLSTAAAQGYARVPPSPGTLAVLSSQARSCAGVGLLALLLLWLPWTWARRRVRPRRALAWAWGILAATGLWMWRGYSYNRFDVGALWRRSSSWAGIDIPAALTDKGALSHNVGLTLAAAALAAGLAWVFWQLLGHVRTVPSWRPARALTVVALVGLVPLALRPAAWGRPDPRGPDVILISLDAVRADHLGCYGYGRPTTPNLDRFAAESERFLRAYSQEPWTLTSHMSMLTGLYPDAHGLDFGRSLAPSVWTLPEMLREAGYRTWGSVFDCFLLDARFGYAAGFDHYAVNGHAAARRCREAGDWILSGTRPAFVFLHLYDPHSDRGVLPYEADEPFVDHLAPGAAEGFADWTEVGGASETLRKVNEEGLPLPDELREKLRRLYDAGLAETDAAVGELLDRLRRAGRLDRALVIVLSDHGEALGERGHFMHERLMEATLHIPLLIHWPGGARAGTVRSDLVETVDLLPTVLGVTGVGPRQVMQGHDLAQGPTGRRAAFSRSGLEYAMTTADGWRLVYERTPGGVGKPVALRRAGESPGDGPDVMAEHGDLVGTLMEQTESFHRTNEILAARFSGGKVEITGSDTEMLRALGYVE